MKKIISLLLVIALTVVITIGGTLAYLQDRDAQVNTFTTGNVYIDLWEDFGSNSGVEKLIPTTGKDADGNVKNAVEKEVYITNTGSEDSFVRVHIAIPAALDDARADLIATGNILHFNMSKESLGKDLWDWSKEAADGAYIGNWNRYTTVINGVNYNVYVVTYGAALKPNETTVDAIHQVYLDSKVTNEMVKNLIQELGQQWKLYVAAEGAQAAGFDDAYTALNTAFGVPGTYVFDWTAVTGGESNNTFVDTE